MSGGGTKGQMKPVQETTSTPWVESQPYLKDVMAQARQLIQSGQGQSFPQGDWYAGLGNITNSGINSIQNNAQNGVQNLAGANSALGGIINGSTAIDPSMWQSIYNTAMNGNDPASGYLDETARGDFLGGANPYLNTLYQGAADDIENRTKSLFSGMGRYGSEVHQDALTDSLGQTYAGIYAPAYENERNRMLQAAGMLGNQQTANLGIATGAAGGLSGVEGQNINNRMAAAGMIPGLEAASYLPGQMLLQAGQLKDEAAQGQLNADLMAQMFNQQAPMDALSWYQNLISGAGGGYGTATTSEPYRPGLKFLGALTSILGGLGGFMGG